MMTDNWNFWNRVAVIYTFFQEKGHRKLYDTLAGKISSLITGDILEIGCGTGQLTTRLAPFGHSWLATDFSPAMTERTVRRSADIAGVSCQVEDATKLTLPSGSFDTVICANVLHIMPDPDAALKEIMRVLRPGGMLIAPTFIYDGKEKRLMIRLMEMAGFHTFHKWSRESFTSFISNGGFDVISADTIAASPLTNCLLIARNPG